jgi:predicted lipid-binding transport protein (Tim44 family)
MTQVLHRASDFSFHYPSKHYAEPIKVFSGLEQLFGAAQPAAGASVTEGPEGVIRMGNSDALIEIIILAVVAGFLILRLRSVLGKRHGHERQRYEEGDQQSHNKGEGEEQNITPFPSRIDAEPPSSTGEISKVHSLDPNFSEEEFLAGAREAFRMILAAYAGSDRETLRALSNNEVYQELDNAISKRDELGESLDATLIGIQSASINAVDTIGSIARITVRFESEQTNVTRNSEGQPIDGVPNQVETIIDLWTFERDLSNSDPNWQLIDTEPGE